MAEKMIAESNERLRQEKTRAKSRLITEKSKLLELLQVGNTSKNKIKRYINKIKAEFPIIERLLRKLKELAVFENVELSSEEVDSIEKELEEIGEQADDIIEAGELHIKQRFEKGELESTLQFQRQSDINSVAESKRSESGQCSQSELSEANRRVGELHEEEIMKEKELTKNVTELELTRRRTEEARKIGLLIDARSQNTAPQSNKNGLPRQNLLQSSSPVDLLVSNNTANLEGFVQPTKLDSNAPSLREDSVEDHPFQPPGTYRTQTASQPVKVARYSNAHK